MSIEDEVEMARMYERNLSSIVKAYSIDSKPDADVMSTLNYALAAVKDKRRNLVHVAGIVSSKK